MLRPHHGEHAEFGKSRGTTEPLPNRGVLVVGQSVRMGQSEVNRRVDFSLDCHLAWVFRSSYAASPGILDGGLQDDSLKGPSFLAESLSELRKLPMIVPLSGGCDDRAENFQSVFAPHESVDRMLGMGHQAEDVEAPIGDS